ncbi:Piso0_000293 [Millerozyma farinosa CBS 7064]|uniref:Piso0_000293 protein n=1 Tax=Pichia sorbitophila (strain ATCC MYA-4447 / BCRC 22081 / CBS 7064 / NBRC 10061 / NRRL Y-12695) TaxID=559304 RepID=G8YTL2_PICSO|nr:Piso0_000293 [Millerozyma farinosa CBS 7064]
MEEILAKAGSQAVTFAIRSGISLASGFAIKTVTKFLDKIPDEHKKRIIKTRNKIQMKIEIVLMTIDLIKLASARGNTILSATNDLIDDLTSQFEDFDRTLNSITENLTNINEKDSVSHVESYMRSLLQDIDEAIPLLNLSLTTCGVNLNGNLPNNVSPGRLLQASNIINESNVKYSEGLHQVGPAFDLVFYSIFYNPSRMKYVENEGQVDQLSSISWKEEYARCSAKILRHGSADSFAYKFLIEENYNDGRYHEDEVEPKKKEFNLSSITKLFFTASGQLLRLESRSSPVLILKLKHVDGHEEWIGLGELHKGEFDDDDDYEDEIDDEENDENRANDEEDKEEHDSQSNDEGSDGDEETFYNAVDSAESKPTPSDKSSSRILASAKCSATSLSLLEYIIRLATLQQNDGVSILNIKDEHLSAYLRDENSHNSFTSIIPKSKKSKSAKKTKDENLNAVLALDSNTKRLESLKINKQ